MPAPFAHHNQADGSFRVWQVRHGRYVGADYAEYQAFLASGGTPDEVPYVAPEPGHLPVMRISKLKLRRNLRALGLEGALDAYLAAHPTALADWNDATELREDDPLLASAIPDMAAAAGITTEQAQELLSASQAEG
jgi:hypothetical protein